MKLHSPYLNPFQPFPERKLDSSSDDRPGSAIENNMSRSVFSALASSESPCAVATFLEVLSQGSTVLRQRVEFIAKVLRESDAETVEFGLQSWPEAAMKERERLEVLLIGISSSSQRDWTHNQRRAPERPTIDAWVYVPSQILLAVECKNDKAPLDATQISAYAHALGLFTDKDQVPRAATGKTLACAADAQLVQKKCENCAVDADWSSVVKALKQIQQDQRSCNLQRWLCRQAAEYIGWHMYPPYCGMKTILEWLNGPDTPDRRTHLRHLVSNLGDTLRQAAHEPGAITFATKEDGTYDLRSGAGAALYVKLMCGGVPLQLSDWPEKYQKINAVLWFHFTENMHQDRIGIDYYLQAPGSHTTKSGETAWNESSARHLACAENFEKLVAEWSQKTPPNRKTIVSCVRFRGNKANWHGGGIEDRDGPSSGPCAPQDAFVFLQTHRHELWRFPPVGTGLTFEEARSQVRKPDLTVQIALDAAKLIDCDQDSHALQEVLKSAITT